MTEPRNFQHLGLPSCIHLTIEFNQHAMYYETVEKWLADHEGDNCWFEWVSPEERQRAIDTDSVWTCQWYPITPVGFHAIAASTFEALMTALKSASS
jgi:hypothetical protein